MTTANNNPEHSAQPDFQINREHKNYHGGTKAGTRVPMRTPSRDAPRAAAYKSGTVYNKSQAVFKRFFLFSRNLL